MSNKKQGSGIWPWVLFVIVVIGVTLAFLLGGCGNTIPQRDTAVVPDPCCRRDAMMHPYADRVTAPMYEPGDE